MANCFECKVYGLAINALCPEHDEEGYPMKPCYQFEPLDEENNTIQKAP